MNKIIDFLFGEQAESPALYDQISIGKEMLKLLVKNGANAPSDTNLQNIFNAFFKDKTEKLNEISVNKEEIKSILSKKSLNSFDIEIITTDETKKKLTI